MLHPRNVRVHRLCVLNPTSLMVNDTVALDHSTRIAENGSVFCKVLVSNETWGYLNRT